MLSLPASKDHPGYLFDIETNSLLDELTTGHVLVIKDFATKERGVFSSGPLADGTFEEGVRFLLEVTLRGVRIIGHNAIKFDRPALTKLYPWFLPDPSLVWDTLVLSRLLFPELKEKDGRLLKAGKLPKYLYTRYSLEAWGYRLGDYKGDYQGDPDIPDEEERMRRKWEHWNQAMEDYCVQDVEVTDKLWTRCLKEVGPEGFSVASLQLEVDVAYILARQERYGFLFDKEKAAKLYSHLVSERLRLEAHLRTVFHPRYFKDGKEAVAKRDNKTLGYVKDAPFQKVKLVEFNPASRDHIAAWLRALYKWEPEEFTTDGKAKIDEAILNELPYKEAQEFKAYFIVDKRIGQIAEGKEAWLRHERNGRIHGQVTTTGAVTSRMTHSKPNMGQVPAGYSPYGHECRELFYVPPGKVLVGADASSLELCDFAGYLGAYDGGAYIKAVLEGSKKDGTDIHSINARALGLDPKKIYFEGETGRDIAKTWFYAFLYGAGDGKLGFILTKTKGPAAAAKGRASKQKFLNSLPAMGKLVKAVQKAAKRGWLRGLDGRKHYCRSIRASLNTLLQGCGAIQMKKALVILDKALQDKGYIPGVNYEFVANVHDEWQIEADQAIGEDIGKTAVLAIQQAGRALNFRCPLDGEYKVGRNWAETH